MLHFVLSHTHMYACMCNICFCVCKFLWSVWFFTYIHMYMCVCIHVCVLEYIDPFCSSNRYIIHAYMYPYIYVCVYVCIYILLDINFENITVGLHALYVLKTHVKFCLNWMLFTIQSINLLKYLFWNKFRYPKTKKISLLFYVLVRCLFLLLLFFSFRFWVDFFFVTTDFAWN